MQLSTKNEYITFSDVAISNHNIIGHIVTPPLQLGFSVKNGQELKMHGKRSMVPRKRIDQHGPTN